MKANVYTIEGVEKGSTQLSETVFGLPYNEALVWQAVNSELANLRLGTANTRDRGEVQGSNAKPYRQKGTGRARRGDIKSPLLVGGGVIFGPKPRDFSYPLPKKLKRLALKTVLSLKVKNGMLKVIEDFTIKSGKTKEVVNILKKLGIEGRATIILKNDDSLLKRAGRNIPYLCFLSYSRLCASDLFYSRTVLLLEGAAQELNVFYGDVK
jgi:large subunit ribosomal protein L4